MAAPGEATVTHSRLLENAAILSVWINTGYERRAGLGRDRHAVDSPLPWRRVAQVAKSAT
jgi:hypothetical protein